MKKVFALLVVTILLGGLLIANAADYNITLAAAVQTDTAMYKAAEQFKKNVEERTNGKVFVDLVFAAVLGGDREMSDSIMMGDIEMAYLTDIGFATSMPEIGYVNLPYLFPDYESVDTHYFNGYLGESLKEDFAARGLRILGWGENDYRSLTSNHPIEKLEDLKGMKIRTPEFPSLLAFFQELGANPTPMSFAEVISALQQGTIDGQDNGPILTQSNRFYEVQKYFTWTNHVYSGAMIVVNEDYYQKLPEDIQQVLSEEGEAAGKLQVQWNRENVAHAVKVMEDAGVIISSINPEMDAAFKQAALKVWDRFKDQYKKEAMNYIFENLQ